MIPELRFNQEMRDVQLFITAITDGLATITVQQFIERGHAAGRALDRLDQVLARHVEAFEHREADITRREARLKAKLLEYREARAPARKPKKRSRAKK